MVRTDTGSFSALNLRQSLVRFNSTATIDIITNCFRKKIPPLKKATGVR